MRGTGTDEEPNRNARVFFLTDEAVEVLERNRLRRRLLGLPPVLDSQLIEGLLLAYQSQGEPDIPAGTVVVDESRQETAPTAKLVREFERQTKLLKQLEAQEIANKSVTRRQVDWTLAEQKLLGAHRHHMPHAGHGLALRLRSALGGATSDVQAMRIVDTEVVDYLGRLVDSLLPPQD